MSHLILHIHNPGDPSIGLWPIRAKVTIEDNVVWNQEDIQEFKKFYAEMYNTDIENVGTDEEAWDEARNIAKSIAFRKDDL